MQQPQMDKLQQSEKLHKNTLYAGVVWIVSALSLTAYGIMGLFNATIPGAEEMVTFLSSIDGQYIYLGAFVTIFLEGLYFIGSFFPGGFLVVILVILSQLGGYSVFLITILIIFFGWSMAGAVNIFTTKLYRSQIIKLKDVEDYNIKDRVWTTWFPAFRANYEVAQTIEGGNPLKVFASSMRVKFYVTIAVAIITLIIPFFVDINNITNEEGFVILFVVAVISFVVGVIKIRHYYLSACVGKHTFQKASVRVE